MSSRSDRPSALAAATRFHLADLCVEPQRLRVLREAHTITLEPRQMEVLVALCEQAGEVVSAEQLLIDVWHGSFYGDNPVHKCIAQLRQRLGDDSRQPRYIQTIRKRGYRLLAPVTLPEGGLPRPALLQDWSGDSPYVGLQAFESRHAPVFFGRSAATAEVLQALRRQVDVQRRLVLLSGSSGCGKSSLVSAGVLPLLTQAGGFQGLRAESVARCDLGRCRGGDLLQKLAESLCQWSLCGRPVFLASEQAEVMADLRSGGGFVARRLQDAWARRGERRGEGSERTILLLVVDHAEAAVATPGMRAQDRADLGRALQQLCGLERMAVLAVTRSDFFPRLVECVPQLVDLKGQGGHVDLLPPRASEIARIIRWPAAMAGLRFEEEAASGSRLDDVLRDAAMLQPDALPLLQHCLNRLYEGRSEGGLLGFQCYRGFGGLEGALAHRAEEVFLALPEAARAQLDAVLRGVVVMQADSDAVTARALPREELTSPHAVELVDALVRARLFVAELHQGEAVLRVAHEALLRQWPRVVAWIAENRGLLQGRNRLQRAAQHWAREQRRDDHLLNPGRPLEEARDVARRLPRALSKLEWAFLRASEASSRRGRRVRWVGMASLLVVACFAVASAWQAQRAQERAEQRREQAKELVGFLLGEVADSLRASGSLTLLEGVSGVALNYLEGLPQSEMRLRESIVHAQALRTVGEVLFGQARFEEAGLAFVRAETAIGRALAMDSGSREAHRESGTVAYWRGYLAYRERRFEETRRHWEAYFSTAERLVALDPGDEGALLELSYALNNLGSLAHRQRRIEDALALFARAVDLKRDLVARKPRQASLQFELVDSLSWLSTSQESAGQFESAALGYAEQIATLRALLGQDPGADAWRRRLATALLRQSQLALDTGHTDLARAAVDESESLLLALTQARPENQIWRRDLAHAQTHAAWVMQLAGQAAEASGRLNGARATLAPLMQVDSALPEWRLLDAVIQLRLAQLQAPEAGLQAGKPAVAELEAFHARYPEDLQAAVMLAEALLWRGDTQQALQAAAAASDWLRARALLADAAPSSRDRRLLDVWVRLHSRLGRENEATAALAWLHGIGYRQPDFIRFHPQPLHMGAAQ
ncbi:winged helix-turn-helix domain-containing protein [Aquimonas voraii]|uniref:Transcriptional regulator n=1 Tax=Aquimonas voraii TaxID=265719 RepID=A0A1G6V2T8_9GAMM|nr:winged helix-turn-helix domain-containing protein [Aquimonas voraii]SDD47245.1 transcriptional regulator [Aquimonas voraii]